MESKVKTVQFSNEVDEEKKDTPSSREVCVDGQLCFRIRKTKNSENIKSGLNRTINS